MYDRNMDNDGKTKTGWLIPTNVKDNFTNFCNRKGCVIQDECAGALIIWQFLPAEIRELARIQAKGLEPIDKQFWNDFSTGLQQGIRDQRELLHKKQAKKKR